VSTDPHPPPPTGWRRYRQEILFLLTFAAVLAGGFSLIAWKPVNDHVIEPFTAGIAKASGATLVAIGQPVAMQGTVIRGPRFAVNIRNGCNGVEAMIIFLGAILAFPGPWSWRLKGLVLGVVAIQAVNLVRVVALYLTGAYFPALFDSSHTVIWQTVVILFAVLLWLWWAGRLPAPQPAPVPAAASE
jgi:exosortase H (IPTLxxWG-CTERM-specific)